MELIAQTTAPGRRRCDVHCEALRPSLVERGLGKPLPPPTQAEETRAELRRDYETYLRRQRGLSESTIFHCWRFADRFLEFRFGEKVDDLSRITPATSSAFCSI